MTSEHIARLQQTPVFGGLRADALEFLVGVSKTVEYPPRAVIIQEGDLGDRIYVIESGRVEVLKALGDELRVLKILGPGECFGEMALLDISPRSATVRALEACRALEIPSAALYKLYERDLEQFTLLTLNMGREVSRRLRETERMLSRRA
ncbi:MAG: cyclic nucleotide-binding domain-containing protein [Zoogloeaceae bacterium]|nr:cyclic nucleotide-binding domain-containing protein [Zoogloeaceae bacterium]